VRFIPIDLLPGFPAYTYGLRNSPGDIAALRHRDGAG